MNTYILRPDNARARMAAAWAMACRILEIPGKPRWRWVENRMTRDCGSWKVPDGLVPYPVIVGWDCGGCKWKPE